MAKRILRYFSIALMTVLMGTFFFAGASAQDSEECETPTLTEEDVTLDLYIETGFDLPEILIEEFARQYPNISYEIRKDQFQVITENASRVMASDNAPDLIRVPQIVGPAQNGLLLNLDPYFEAYCWDAFPPSQLEQLRVGEDGIRGSGSLYALGLGYNVTGVYYNLALAEQIGMTEAPQTIAEFEALLEQASASDILPIMQFNDIGGALFPYQALFNQFADIDEARNWIYQAPDSNFNTPAAVRAAEYLERWGEAGYFPEDVNSVDYTNMVGRFVNGEGLFMFNGDWEAANLANTMEGNVGFFLFPPENADGTYVAMGAPATYVVPANAPHADEIVYFLNWVHTNEEARRIIVETTGAAPGGPPSLPVPSVPEGSVVGETLLGANQLGADGIIIDFLANSTPGIYASAFRPELQLLIAGRSNPEDFVQNIQTAYDQELGR